VGSCSVGYSSHYATSSICSECITLDGDDTVVLFLAMFLLFWD